MTNTLKLLFLDFDGVVNSKKWLERRPGKEDFSHLGLHPGDYDYEQQIWGLHSIDPEAVELLNKIVDGANCRVVISSSWRLIYPLTKLEWMLRCRGYKHRLLGATPYGPTLRARDDRRIERGEEIAAWISTLNLDIDTRNIVIIDDDADMAHLSHRLYNTKWDEGLTESGVDYILNMLHTGANGNLDR
jgi:hypothetical protein